MGDDPGYEVWDAGYMKRGPQVRCGWVARVAYPGTKRKRSRYQLQRPRPRYALGPLPTKTFS